MRVEHILFGGVLKIEEVYKKVFPYFQEEYFHDPADKLLYRIIQKYCEHYSARPTLEASLVELHNLKDVPSEDAARRAHEYFIEIFKERELPPLQWFLEEGERFCQDRAMHNAVLSAARVIEQGEKSKTPRTAIPEMMKKALSINFDTKIGHNYLENADERLQWYHNRVSKVPFGLDYFDKITNGGVERKSLNILSGGTGVGKSLMLCSLSSTYILQGLNVLYITLELSEEKVAERIDANLLDISIERIRDLEPSVFKRKMASLRERKPGKLIIKEYPTTSAGAGHFRYLFDELKEKKGFIPDVTCVDYLQLCKSMRMTSEVNSYSYVKSIAEELRGLAVEENQVLWTASQINRAGYSNSDPGLEHIADSFGAAYTADLLLIIFQSEEMEKLDQIMVKQTTKNRYGNTQKYKRFLMGIDKDKQKIYELEDSAQTLIDPSEKQETVKTPIMDKTAFSGFY